MNVAIDIGSRERDDEWALRVRIVKADRCVGAPPGMQRDQCVATLPAPLLRDHRTVTEAA